MPNKVSYKSVTSGKGFLARISKRKGITTSGVSSVAPSKKPKRAPKASIPEVTDSAPEISSETFEPPSSLVLDPITIVIPDRVPPPSNGVPVSGVTSPQGVPPPESSSGSSDAHGIPFDKEFHVERILECFSPDELHGSFSHFQLKAMKCAYGLFLKWKEAEDSRAGVAADKSSLEERLAEALARASDFENKYEDLLVVRDGLLKSESDLIHQYEADVDVLKKSLEESKKTS
ncbi:hypothetical protein LIER_33776 [Lithospermum erythrorhizon]|uniref:Uncharacterized protein n=1 Tax=Lithospermum erythrorhizon TaxID=34254 RepID=A0AAV3RZE1_LITER